VATGKFTLKHGLKIGDDFLKKVTIKSSLTAGEIFDASEAAEKITVVGEGENEEPVFVMSPTLMAAETLCRQIVCIDDLQGPLSLKQLRSLDEEDLQMLNRAADVMQKMKVSKEVARRGRSDSAA